jgi:hypothetical protein
MGGQCSASNCDRPICQSCWGSRNRRVCPTHSVTPGPSYQKATQAIQTPSAPRPTSSLGSVEPDVRFPLLRDRFLDGFVARIEGHPRIETATGVVIGNVRDWERSVASGGNNSTVGESSRSRPRRKPKLHISYHAVACSVPVRQNSLGTNLKQARLEARVVDVESFRQHPGERRPVPAEMLAHMLETDLKTARRTKRHHVVGIFAFDGWEDEATALFTSEKTQERFLNPNLSPMLFGPDLATVVWNANDPVISALTHYFSTTFEDDVAKCKAHVLINMKDSGIYLVSRLVDEAGFAPGVAKTAAESLAQEQEVFLIEERGELAIVRKEIS